MAQEWLQDSHGVWGLWDNGSLIQVLANGASPPNDGLPTYPNQTYEYDYIQAPGAQTASGSWWDSSIFGDLTGGSSNGPQGFNFGTGFMGIGVGSGPDIGLPKLPWLLILAGVAVIVVAVAARR
ncbi:MAG: hypothetical protein ACM3Q1_05870 [Bacteroidales bacterium]